MTEIPSAAGVEAKTVNRVSGMTLIIPIKQGLTQPLTRAVPPQPNPNAPPVRWVENLAVVLGAIQEYSAQGENALNEVATIHSARWVIINGGRNLLFCATYDTSLDQYLSDFMTIANVHAPGHVPWMDLLWGNCVGYPGGEPTQFIAWARSWQVETNLLFPTISDMTVRDIAWLRKFKHLFDQFDQDGQQMDWPHELRSRYQDFKRAVNAIDVSVVR